MILQLLDKAGIHIHKHDTTLYSSDTDRVGRCRCGHLEHYANNMHRYVENRQPAEKARIRRELLEKHAMRRDFYTL